MNTCSRVIRTSDWGESSPYNRTTVPKHTAKTTQEWLRDKSLNVLEGSSQIPGLWRVLKIAVQQRSLSNLTELERVCREEWEKLPKYRCAKLVASYTRTLDVVNVAKGASTKYRVKDLNTYVNVIFPCFLKQFLFRHYWVFGVD